MLENITKEEYNDAQSKLPDLKRQLFDARFSMATNRDVEQLKLLEGSVSAIKKEIARTKTIMKVYELENNIESKKRGK